MYQPTATRSEAQYRSAPSVTVSVVLAALTVGLVVLASVVAMAPAVVGAFLAGAVTAVVVTVVHRVEVENQESQIAAESRPQ